MSAGSISSLSGGRQLDPTSTQAETSEASSTSPSMSMVLLHGWGCDQRSWRPLTPYLASSFTLIPLNLPSFGEESPCEQLDDYIDALLEGLPERFVVMGWSLGGMVATRIAARYPQRVVALITLAANLSFIRRSNWPEAMVESTFESFVQSYQQAQELTIKRFAGLMVKGDRDEKSLLKPLRACALESTQRSQNTWEQGLQWLRQIDNREAFSQLRLPGLHFMGADDALVPVAAAPRLAALNSEQQVEVMAGCGHSMHWSQPEYVAAQVINFLQQVLAEQLSKGVVAEEVAVIDKRKVAQSFGRAASKYDSVVSDPEGFCIDMGCGTGYFMPLLAPHCQQLMGLDLAEGMIRYARQTRDDDYLWLCADAEHLPLAEGVVDTVFSALAIQWCSDLQSLFRELARVVKPGGRIYLATLGPRTLWELRAAWSQVDKYDHVNQFAGEPALRAAAAAAGLVIDNWSSEDIVLHYHEVRELTYELKTLGAHNMNRGQSSGLTGRQRIVQFKQAYEQFRSGEQLPATYEVFYLELTLQ